MYRVLATSTKFNQYKNELLESAAKQSHTIQSEYLGSLLLENLIPQTKTAT